METLKLRANLFRRGNEIISYNTVVAHIEGKQLIEHGKYSRTTGKHVAYVAQLFNLRIVQSNVRKRDRSINTTREKPISKFQELFRKDFLKR